MGLQRLPRSVIAAVSDVLGDSFTHTQLNTILAEAGAPGDPPEGNKVDKVAAWLKRADADHELDVLALLGRALEEFMERTFTDGPAAEDLEREWSAKRERVTRALAAHGLRYAAGGHILGGVSSTPARDFAEQVRRRDLKSVEAEFERALASIEKDPADAVTAACSLLESIFRTIIEDEKLEIPAKKTVASLWKPVKKNLNLDPEAHEDHLLPILTGLAAVVDGIGAFRDNSGDAHGKGRSGRRPTARHARLVVHASLTLGLFVLETWDLRRGSK